MTISFPVSTLITVASLAWLLLPATATPSRMKLNSITGLSKGALGVKEATVNKRTLKAMLNSVRGERNDDCGKGLHKEDRATRREVGEEAKQRRGTNR